MSRTLPRDNGVLCRAVAAGDQELVASLLSSGSNVNEASSDGKYPLVIAAFQGHAEIAKQLLEANADVNVANMSTGWTPCHAAAIRGHGKVLLYLMEQQPDLSLKDTMGRTAVDFASAQDSIWPYFGVLKCQRTSKENLIRLDVIRKEEEEDLKGSESEQVNERPRSTKPLSYYSRPGSSYVLTEQSTKNELSSKSKSVTAAVAYGDILYEER
ncbi:PREDICTED: ankyrin repeat domain-containing protein 50-like [Amphimedon queenslandica]|uniref:Uncharacterized protein n=1 Tax=Amphimedon queenslandica TaxID=400682 RepID=A0A1X7UWH0_AMPQE|nr:PREDICTED: ankyrin repeat domain-containing protein 50-like [Amphimedon queenslandica]|eukprot:XP_003386570.1 PREDICTED: ankyrin repeat domain-containing protein 50-like [Amphimedon queenslandica]